VIRIAFPFNGETHRVSRLPDHQRPPTEPDSIFSWTRRLLRPAFSDYAHFILRTFFCVFFQCAVRYPSTPYLHDTLSIHPLGYSGRFVRPIVCANCLPKATAMAPIAPVRSLHVGRTALPYHRGRRLERDAVHRDGGDRTHWRRRLPPVVSTRHMGVTRHNVRYRCIGIRAAARSVTPASEWALFTGSPFARHCAKMTWKHGKS